MLKMVAGHDATQHFEEMHRPEILTSIGSLYRIGRLEVAATTAAEAAVAPQAGNSNAHGGDSGSSVSATAAAPKPEADDAAYTMAEVEQHSSKTDCWIVIGNFPVVCAHPATLSVPWIHSLSATITAHCAKVLVTEPACVWPPWPAMFLPYSRHGRCQICLRREHFHDSASRWLQHA